MSNISQKFSVFLDSVRWIGALLVVTFHVRAALFVPWAEINEKKLIPLLIYGGSTLGHQAVVVFFVLSGYLVGGTALEKSANGSMNLRKYYINRISRIYAVLPLALILGWCVDYIGNLYLTYPIFINGVGESFYITERLTVTVFLGNLLNLGGLYVPYLGSNGALWSLVYEFWYYILFPIVIYVGSKRQLSFTRILLFCVLIAILLSLGPRGIFYAAIWTWGALLPRLNASKLGILETSCLVAAGIIASLILPQCISTETQKQIGWAVNAPGDIIVATTFGLLMISVKQAIKKDGPVKHSTYAKVSSRLAGFSFTLYVCHSPILYAVNEIYMQKLGGVRIRPDSKQVSIFIGYMLFIYSTSYMISYVTERNTPALRVGINRLCENLVCPRKKMADREK